MPKKKQAKKETLKKEPVKKLVKKKTFRSIPLKSALAYLGLFIVLSFILYFQCLLYGYVLDDKIVLSENNYVKQGFDGIWSIFSTDSFQGYFGEQKNLLQGGRYRPLSLVTFAIEHHFLGLNSKISHHINVILYGICGFISFITLRRLFKEKFTTFTGAMLSLAFLSTLLFMVHPIHTEAVANIKGRDELLTFFFSFLTFYFSLKYIDHKKLLHLVFVPIFFFLGLLSKENTITFLAIIPFGLMIFRKRSYKSIAVVGLSLLATTILYLIIRFQIFGFILNADPSTDIMNNPFYGASGIERFSTVMYTSLLYLKLCIFPHPLTHDYYPYHIPIMRLSDWQVILSLILHTVIIGAVFYFWKKRKTVSFAIGFYLASLSIVSNLFVNVGTFMNERFVFIASLGICILVVYLFNIFSSIAKEKSKMMYLGLVGIVALSYSFKTIDRVPAWESELALNTEAIKVSKNSARANSFMATALFNQYKETQDRDEKIRLLNEAEPYMQKAVKMYPNYKNANIMRAGIAAEIYKHDNDLGKLLNEFKAVAAVRPDIDYVTQYMKYLNKRADVTQLTNFYTDVAEDILLININNPWAVHYLLLAYEINPNDLEINNLLVEAYNRINRPDLAQKHIR